MSSVTIALAVALLSSANALTDLKTDWEAYASELTIPEVIDMTKGGAIDMQIGRSTHNWTEDGSIAGAIYGYALKNSTPTSPGPTIKVAREVPINITWYNELEAPHLLQESVQYTLTQHASACYPYCGVPVVTHVHGMESPARYDGLPFLSIYKNQSQEFVYMNNQSASTKTYHDHSNGLTRLNTWAGLVGAYIISDSELESSLNLNIETDIPLILTDRLISNTGKIMYSDDNCNEGATLWVPESFGSVNQVNGVVMPYVNVPPAQVRFRLVNAANARHYSLTMPFADKCQVVATDSGFVGEPKALTADLVIFPFERVEFVCDFSGVKNGTMYNLEDKQTSDQATPYDNRVMQFRILESLKTDSIAQCGETEETVNTNELKDVVVIPNAGDRKPDTITQVCYVAWTPGDYLLEGSTRGAKEFNFDTTDPYLAHCHILEHEENAMMAWFNIQDVDNGYADDNGITPGTEITDTVIATAMGMSVLGGLATTLSVLVISVKRLNFLASPLALSVAFALSSGVMLFIGLADLFEEAVTFYRAHYTTGNADPEAYEKGGSASTGVCDNTCNGNAYLTAVAAFFGGVVIILLVEFLVHSVFERKKTAGEKANAVDVGEIEEGDKAAFASPVPESPANGNHSELQSPATAESSNLLEQNAGQKEEYRRAGVMTGIAVAIHNFPEGLALFVSSLSGLRSGIVLSIGIILHNFPEGVAVAAPVYYATGSKMEAFKWTALSGIAQPFGAAIGWAAVSGGMSFALEASLYGIVAGMLVCITVKELLPGAYRFDPSGKAFVVAFFGGLGIIALSIMALKYAGSS
ncbi:hypothetical protein PInf_000714 [Phytophthora infestans]|nr:hypothetical protein PInf_000714 [Phytophthora infestans]